MNKLTFLTVKTKSWVLEKKFSNAFNIFLHKLYYNISQLCLESLITQKNQPFSRAFSLTNFVLHGHVNISVAERFLFIVST